MRQTSEAPKMFMEVPDMDNLSRSFSRWVQAPRTSQDPAEYARAIQRESGIEWLLPESTHAAEWSMVGLAAGMFIGWLIWGWQWAT